MEEFGAALENSQGFFSAGPAMTARPSVMISMGPANYSGSPATGSGGRAIALRGFMPRLSRFFSTKGGKIIGTGIVAILVLASIFLAALIRDRRSALSLNVNFAGSNTTLMASSEVAGVIPESNWNNASGASSSSALNLVNDKGRATSASVTWTSDSVWNLAISDVAGNNRMMRGYLDNASGDPTQSPFPALFPGRTTFTSIQTATMAQARGPALIRSAALA